MSYAICRVQKCNNSHSITGTQIHNRRERTHSNSNPDIDFRRSNQNYSLCSRAAGKSFNQTVDEIIATNYTSSRKIRKDAVKMCEVLFTSDKDFFDKLSPSEQQRYFQRCYDWAAERWGADNIVSADVHVDEQTPHMHLCFVPLHKETDKLGQEVVTLNVHKAVGSGSRAMQQLQDTFYTSVGKPYGLERGVRASLEAGERPRKHQSVAEHKEQTDYYVQQRNTLQATVEGLQGEIDRLNDILHSEPQNAIHGSPVPSMAKIAIGKENKDKLLYSPEDIEKLQELAKAVAVNADIAKKHELRQQEDNAELLEMMRKTSDRYNALEYRQQMLHEAEKRLSEKEKAFSEQVNSGMDSAAKAIISKKEQELQQLQDKYKQQLIEMSKLKSTIKSLERNVISLQEQNGSLSDKLQGVTEQLYKSKQLITIKANVMDATNQILKSTKLMYKAAMEIGERLHEDFDKLVIKRLTGQSVDYILSNNHSENGYEKQTV